MADARSSEIGRSRWSLAAEWYAAGLFLLYALVLFGHAGPPSLTDFANWTYQGVLLSDHLRGVPDTAHMLKSYPVPNSAVTVGIGVLALVLPWMVAAKMWLCAQLLLSFASLKHLFRTTRGNAAVWGIVPTAVFLNTNFWYGFANFEVGLCWVMLMASLLVRREREEEGALRREWVFGGLLLLLFFTHMIPFAFAGLLLLLYAWQTRRFRVLWQLLPSVVVSAWYLLGRYLVAGDADGQAGMVSPVRSYTAAFWAYKVNSYLKSFGLINPGSPAGSEDVAVFGRVVFALLVLVNVVLCVLLGWRMLRAARRSIGEGAGERFLWYGVAALVPLYLLAPGTALGVSDPGSRLLQAGLALALVLCGRETGRMLLEVVCATVLAMTGLFLFVRLGFPSGEVPEARGEPLPRALVIFAHVPNHDQDYFYDALRRGEMRLPVFPTGMFLNRKAEPSPQVRDGSGR